MNFTHEQVEGFVLAFMGSRCAVSSQHKLPSLAEVLSLETTAFIGVDVTRAAVERLIRVGRIIEYGPYLSDHEIDVL